jgi:ComF family protein
LNIRLLFERIAPHACLLCGVASGASRLCSGCTADLPLHTQPQCPQCALPTPDGERCGACLKRAPAFDFTLAACAYAFPVDRLIQALKYDSRLVAGVVLGQMLARAAQRVTLPDRLIAMPLHPVRIRERGFNHALEIGRVVATNLGVALDTQSCRRIRDTPPQVALAYAARRRNVRGAFVCETRLDGERVALIDDVMTTGSSLDELAATLKAAGASEVSCWVVARALPPGA